MNQQERRYYDHTADPSTMIMYKKMMKKEKILNYTMLSVVAATAFLVFIVILQIISKI